MHVKRWLLVLAAGIALVSLGLAYLLLYLAASPATLASAALQPVSRPLVALLLGGLGIGLITWSLVHLKRSLLRPFVAPGQEDVAQKVYHHHRRRRGPKIVALGGGTGLSTLLRGLKDYSDNITAIVSVADDGGSSGRLREAMGVLPPGDIRQCIVALSEEEGLTSRLFQYRFSDEMGLEGHSFGNLFITAMAEVTGSFEKGVRESSRVLAVRGQVIPTTLQQVTLGADLRVGNGRNGHRWRRVIGESAIPNERQEIVRVFLEPENVPANPDAIKAILDADMIVAGPGSLFTSILPNLLVPTITAALRAAQGTKVYVCNVATQPGETSNFDVVAHVEALQRHVGNLFSVVLANDHIIPCTGPMAHLEPVALPETPSPGYELVTADVIDEEMPWRHDSNKLAAALMDIYARPDL